ncbi:MAG: hypothetical protein WAQ24_02860, partial [Candidatus Saccharimonadales bacterium]
MLSTIFIDSITLRGHDTSYTISDAAQSIIPRQNPTRAASLKFDAITGIYNYNKGFTPGSATGGTAPGPKFTAAVGANATDKGVTVTDPITNTSLTLTPQFSTRIARQNQNQLIYPINGQNAQKVYTFGGSGVREDLVLNQRGDDKATFAYKLKIPSGTEARLERNGDIAVYGVNAALLGNVTTGSDKDAALLEKARTNSAKSTLLFTIPKPVVLEYGRKVSQVKTWFTLQNSVLNIHASGLAKATYPLTIDPSVYIETAQKLMLGNNETNTDFDVTNDLIQKGQTTGARIDAWSSTSNLSNAVWGQGTAVAGGYIYSAGGIGSGTTT